MTSPTASSSASSPHLAKRRLAAGLSLSILFHVLLLALQFGVPGVGMPLKTAPQPLSVVLAPSPAPAPPAAPPQTPPDAVPSVPAAPASLPEQAGHAMQVVDSVAPPPPPPPPPKPVPRKGKPAKSRRVSTPLPPVEPVDTPTRVIAQDQKADDSFAMPLPTPEESVQKTIDPNQAQHGADDGTEKASMAAEAEA
ncbi:MAG: hypothetical protein ABIT83_14910, partial [Massilia sp.]